MEEGLPARPIFFLDGRRNDSFMKRLGGRTRFFAASDTQRQSAAAIRAIVDDDEDDVDTAPRNEGAHPEEPPLHVIDLSDRPDTSTKSATKPAATLWTRLRTGWEEVEDRLAEWFGLDQSKYQWAVDELLERQLSGDQPASKADVNGLQMQNVQEQSMQRDLKGPKP